MLRKKSTSSKKTPKSFVLGNYKKTLRELSDALVTIQKPIRLLDAIKWDATIQESFFKHKFKKLPPVSVEYYQNIKLSFSPEEKMNEFFELEHQIRHKLGQYNAVGDILQRMCREY